MVLFWLDRKEKAYLWLGLTCCGIVLQTLVTLTGNYTNLDAGVVELHPRGRRSRANGHLRSGFSSGRTGSGWAGWHGCTTWCGDSPLR